MNLALAGDILAAGQDAQCQLLRFQVHQHKGSKAEKSGEELWKKNVALNLGLLKKREIRCGAVVALKSVFGSVEDWS